MIQKNFYSSSTSGLPCECSSKPSRNGISLLQLSLVTCHFYHIRWMKQLKKKIRPVFKGRACTLCLSVSESHFKKWMQHGDHGWDHLQEQFATGCHIIFPLTHYFFHLNFSKTKHVEKICI